MHVQYGLRGTTLYIQNEQGQVLVFDDENCAVSDRRIRIRTEEGDIPDRAFDELYEAIAAYQGYKNIPAHERGTSALLEKIKDMETGIITILQNHGSTDLSRFLIGTSELKN